MMDHHHHAHHHQIPVSIPPVSVHDISRLQQHQIFQNPANIVHEAGTGNNNIHSNNSNNVHVSQNGNGDDGKALVEKSKKGESGEKIVRYRECQKNHAANIGSHALDGCGEFMASGLEGTAEALKCQACGCHRNFHRQEVEGEGGLDGWYSGPAGRSRVDKKRLLPGGGNVGVPLFSSPSPPHTAAAAAANASGPQMLMALSSACTLGDPELHEGFVGRVVGSSSSAMKKRFRTKFSQDQKEKMHAFADQLGWRIQKHDEAAVHQFCNEVGVRRHVLKVWMHNNKNTLGKKL